MRGLLGSIVALIAMALLVGACSQSNNNGIAIVTIIAIDNEPQPTLFESRPPDSLIAPQGVPFNPGTGASGITNVELTVHQGGVQLQFNSDGQIVESGGVPIVLTGGPATLHLPHGSYDLTVEATDDGDNLLADGEKSNLSITADVSVTIDLRSVIAEASLQAPQIVIPNQVVDVLLTIHPLVGSDLVVPTADYEVAFTSANVINSSKRGVRLVVECTPITLQADVSDYRSPSTEITTSVTIPAADVCETYQGPIGVDLLPPSLTIDELADEVLVDQPLAISGAVYDQQTGVVSVTIYDGTIFLGEATIDDQVVPNEWIFNFTPTQTRAYNLTAVARDGAGNERRTEAMLNMIDLAGFRFEIISSGARHTCGLTPTGHAYCWGSNEYGQLGDGTNGDKNSPTLVSGGHTFTAIFASTWHTCGITTDNITLCWGANLEWQLGDGTNIPKNTPTLVSGGHTFTAIAPGHWHTCGITASSAALCWGTNGYRQLGDGTDTPKSSPTPQPVSGGHAFTDITAGHWYNCGITASNALYCWGDNQNGQLGDGTNTERSTPTLVSGGHAFIDITGGVWHTCGITTSNTTYCWGLNDIGQLGDGTITATNIPTLVSSGYTFTTVTAGHRHTCGITTSNTAQCWGINSRGQLGDGTNTPKNTPTPVIGGHVFTSIKSGYDHTCGITTTHATYCWGSNDRGQLGDGTNTDKNSPTPVLMSMP